MIKQVHFGRGLKKHREYQDQNLLGIRGLYWMLVGKRHTLTCHSCTYWSIVDPNWERVKETETPYVQGILRSGTYWLSEVLVVWGFGRNGHSLDKADAY